MRRKLVRALQVVLIVLVAAIVLALAGGYLFLTRSFPQTSGTLRAAGLKSAVEVIRDARGVPQIYASNPDDLFFAQGYVHAQDRLWQMELNRHIGHGQLSELFGDVSFGDSTTVETDKFLRTIGLDRAAQADLETLDPETLRYLQRYAEGVNEFIRTHGDTLPLEFTLLGSKPADWQPVDSLVWGKVMAFDLGGNYEAELLRAALTSKLGAERVRDLIPTYPAGGPFIIPPQKHIDIGNPDLAALASMDRTLGIYGDGTGSNNWVVDGTRTTIGKPLLANDPHLGIQMPAIWYTNGLHCQPVSATCPFDVAGYSFPGVPAVIIGHNARIAWGVTNTGPDVQDLYVEQLNPANPRQYLYRGQWEDMQVEQQAIKVKNGPDVPLTIERTRHGPIMTPVLKGVTATLALQWTVTREPGTLFNAALKLNRAQNWDEFRQALRDWDAPAQNFVYADVDGNIGYQMPGRVPIRARGDGTLPVDGASGDYEWLGYIPFDELPFVYNPSSHYIVTANNKVVPDSYKYLIATSFAAPYRAQRITDLILSKDKLSPDDFKRIQADVYSLPLTRLQKYIAGIKPEGFLGQRAFKYVTEWDGNVTADSVGAAILEVTYGQLARDLLLPVLGEKLYQQYIPYGDAHMLLLERLLDDPNNSWWDDPTTAARETRDDRLARAYFEGVDWLGSQFGDWPPDWQWGRLHTAAFEHPFGSIQPLNLIFNYGPLRMPGDRYTIDNAGYEFGKSFQVDTISSMREIIDLSDLDASLWIHSTGQSGQPLNAHYTDLTGLWRDVQYAPLYFTRSAVERGRSADLSLTP